MFGVLCVAGYFFTRWDPFLAIAFYGGLFCLGLVLLGLVAVIVHRVSSRRFTRAMLLALGVLIINFPASLLYARAMLIVDSSVLVVIHNTTFAPLTDVRLQIGDQTWLRPDVPPGKSDRTTLYYEADSFYGVSLEARNNGELLTRNRPESPAYRRTVQVFRI